MRGAIAVADITGVVAFNEGSRLGRTLRKGIAVLVELIGAHEQFTVKRYTSKKVARGEDEWEHQSIRLEPLNPEYEAFELQPEQIKYVVAEWLETLE